MAVGSMLAALLPPPSPRIVTPLTLDLCRVPDIGLLCFPAGIDGLRKRMPRDGKLALFIDGLNLHSATRALGFDIDYRRLLQEFASRGTLVRAFYYTLIIEEPQFSSVRPLVDWLDYNGFTVVAKRARDYSDGEGRRRFSRNTSIELTVDAMELTRHVDQIILFSRDGAFWPLVQAIQRRGVHVTVVSTMKSRPPIVADELRRQADVFTDLEALQLKIARERSRG
jgi:uncharacterized LabA/DUF88 family protein